jgi:murein DD-endopeptidase MepM/ murein hydrolase activator NlpD
VPKAVAGASPPITPTPITPPPPAEAATADDVKAAPVTPPEPESEAPPAAAPPPDAKAIASAVENHRAPVDPIFYWPVRGQIASLYGPAAGGTHNDGINILAPEGTTISAADGGVVAYAGNELKGFGNLLLIKHDGGWISAYAHAEVLLVKKGQKVRRGQAIARVGDTGGVDRPQLHFELRQGVKAVDPLDHLPPLTQAAG